MTNKLLFLLVGVFCFTAISHAEQNEADWEILNLAISNPSESNPRILANSILNIVSGFGPDKKTPPAAPAPTSSPFPTRTPAPSPFPTTSATSPLFNNQVFQTLFMQYLMSQSQGQGRVPASAPHYYPAPSHGRPSWEHPTQCGPQQKNSIAEFMVNLPCKKTTQKPPRQIVVKVPCPKTVSDKPCACKCCPCNPCPSKKKSHKAESHSNKAESHSAEDSYEDTKTVYKSYERVKSHDPVTKSVGTRRNEGSKSRAPMGRQMSYEPVERRYQRVHVQRERDN